MKQEMTEYEQARWVALMDCVSLIGEAADKSNIPFESVQFNHPAMMHYVDEISDHVARTIKQDT